MHPLHVELETALVFVVWLLAVVELFGCGQETPVEKTRAAAASGNAATQAAGQAAVDAIKTPMDQGPSDRKYMGEVD